MTNIFKKMKELEREVALLKDRVSGLLKVIQENNEEIQIINAKVRDIPIQVEVVKEETEEENKNEFDLKQYNKALDSLYEQ